MEKTISLKNPWASDVSALAAEWGFSMMASTLWHIEAQASDVYKISLFSLSLSIFFFYCGKISATDLMTTGIRAARPPEAVPLQPRNFLTCPLRLWIPVFFFLFLLTTYKKCHLFLFLIQSLFKHMFLLGFELLKKKEQPPWTPPPFTIVWGVYPAALRV